MHTHENNPSSDEPPFLLCCRGRAVIDDRRGPQWHCDPNAVDASGDIGQKDCPALWRELHVARQTRSRDRQSTDTINVPRAHDSRATRGTESTSR